MSAAEIMAEPTERRTQSKPSTGIIFFFLPANAVVQPRPGRAKRVWGIGCNNFCWVTSVRSFMRIRLGASSARHYCERT